MYADPSRQLYHTLGLIENLDRTPAGQEKRSYLGKGFLGNMLSSIWVGVLSTLPARSGVSAMQSTFLGEQIKLTTAISLALGYRRVP